MLAMENSTRYNRTAQLLSSLKQRQSGYEPSDTESEWHDSPWHDLNNDNHVRQRALVSDRPKTPPVPVRNVSPLSRSQRYSSKHDYNLSSPVKVSKTNPAPRRNSRSPYKPHRDDNIGVSSKLGSDLQRSISPFSAASGPRRHISPYKIRREEQDLENDEEFNGSNRKQNQKLFDSESIVEDSRQSERSHYSHRSLSAPKSRTKEKDQQISYGTTEQRGSRSPSPLRRNPSRKQRETFYAKAPATNEVHEMVANAKTVKGPLSNFKMEESIESILPGDIFFSHDYTAVHKNIAPIPERNSAVQHQNSYISGFDQNPQVVPVSTLLSQTNTNSSSVSRQSSKISNGSSKMSDSSGKTNGSFTKFAANRERNQKVQWFSCVRGGACRNSKSPENREIDETSFIEKAFVVENLRQFWADRHRPGSLSGFICHKQQAQHLKQLISLNNCPHILFKGPSGAGKKALIMALLHEIFGDSTWKINHDRRYFHVQETRPMQILVPLASSLHHVELNLKSESKNARYALMAIVKELIGNHMPTPEVSDASFKADFKVIILHEVDNLAENVQHLIKWIMDCYTDACKIILCCEDDTELLESVKSRCKLITVDAPVTHEIMEVLIQIARKENFDLSMSFAAKIATKSKQNLRKAIMALEACKAHNYPFVDEQPIPLGWEEVLVELASEILADPSPKRLFYARGKFQKLLVDFVHPKLILQKLVEQFLKGVEASLKRELYYWHAYYDKRLPTGPSALLKLEEFVAKFMSIYRKSFGRRPFP